MPGNCRVSFPFVVTVFCDPFRLFGFGSPSSAAVPELDNDDDDDDDVFGRLFPGINRLSDTCTQCVSTKKTSGCKWKQFHYFN
jgi:hypothetical protein